MSRVVRVDNHLSSVTLLDMMESTPDENDRQSIPSLRVDGGEIFLKRKEKQGKWNVHLFC